MTGEEIIIQSPVGSWMDIPKIQEKQSIHIGGKVVYMTAKGNLFVTRQALTLWMVDKYNLVKYIILPNE